MTRWHTERRTSGRRRRWRPLGLVVVIVAAAAACTDDEESSSSPAECDQIATLAEEGQPVEDVEAAGPAGPDEPAPAVEVPRIDGLDDVVATIVTRSDPAQIDAGESALAQPDPDVDTLVAVAATDADPDELQRRITDAAESQGMARVGGTRSQRSPDDPTQFTRGYTGPDSELTVASYTCAGNRWLVFRMAVVPPAPESAGTPLPGCAELVARFSADVYAEATWFPDADVPSETDDAQGSERLCRIRQAGTAGDDTHTEVHLRRRAPDPAAWRDRLRDLRAGAAGFVAPTCAGGEPPAPLPDGPPDSVSCTSADTVEAEATVAGVVGNDYWIGVRHTVRPPADQADQADQALATATQILNSIVEGT